jgi:glycerol-3-phosphate dehydrogenase
MFSMKRDNNIKQLTNTPQWDVIVAGGGATGLGVALDAASRGYKTLLLEKFDFAKGTSSRSTKLVHGGVRYLAQGNIKLVREALRERGMLLRNAPHVCHTEHFLLPAYRWYDRIMYGVGLKLYDWLSGKWSLGGSKIVSRKTAMEHLPAVRTKGLRGGILYTDGQFDDARLAINLAQTAAAQGATMLSYFSVTGVLHDKGHISGVTAMDTLTGNQYTLKAKTVINATGVFVEELMKKDNPQQSAMVTPSQGVHIVVDQKFFPAKSALMIPKTDDGRVLFAIPWHNQVVIGTTDGPIPTATAEPIPADAEVDFIIQHFNRYTQQSISRADVKATFAGLRPLVNKSATKNTASISREHFLQVSPSGLITITGGKWTTYRKMAEQVVDKAAGVGTLPARPCKTGDLKIHGGDKTIVTAPHLEVYGTDAAGIELLMKENPSLAQRLHAQHPYTAAQVVWAVRHEMALTVEDFLSRRIRLVLLDAQAATEAAPIVAQLMASEMGKDDVWVAAQLAQFAALARGYLLTSR